VLVCACVCVCMCVCVRIRVCARACVSVCLSVYVRYESENFHMDTGPFYRSLSMDICLFHGRVGISRKNADSRWNPVYKAFHRFFFLNQLFGSIQT